MADERVLTSIWFDRGEATSDWFRAFEAYGHAMASAAALELLLALSLTKQKVKSGEHAMQSGNVFEHANRLRKLSLSKLIPLCRKAFSLPDDLVTGLELGKRTRDFLAHNFWDAYIGLLESAKGIDLLVESCTLECWHFKNLAIDFERAVGFDVMDFVAITRANHDELLAEMESMLAEFR